MNDLRKLIGHLEHIDRGGKVSTDNGPMYVSAVDFDVNDMVLQVVVHASVDGIGASILKSLKI
jgi:hypothetical protein